MPELTPKSPDLTRSYFFEKDYDPKPVSNPGSIFPNHKQAEPLKFATEWLGFDEGAKFAVGYRILNGYHPVIPAYPNDQLDQFQSQLGYGWVH